MTEAVLQKLILARLSTIPGVWVWRNNTGAGRTPEGYVRFGIPGQADISGLILGGRRVEIEVKSTTGRVTAEQAAFGGRIAALGGLYIVARTPEDALTPLIEALR